MTALEVWTWFVTAAPQPAELRGNVEHPFLDEVEAKLHQFCDDLWFEVGGKPEGPMEFVISAEGQERLFDKVLELSKAAPVIPGWLIVPFKQPQGVRFILEYKGVVLDPEECWFVALSSVDAPGRFALRVGVPNYQDAKSEIIDLALYLLVDAGLGELVSSQRIVSIRSCEIPSDPQSFGFIRLNRLGDYIEKLAARSDV